MDPFKFTRIAHKNHRICNPIGSGSLDQLFATLELRPRARVLDLGCGKGEMLIRLVERFQVRGVGVDLSEAFLDEARREADRRTPRANLSFMQMDAAQYAHDAGTFDLVICVGARPFGDQRTTWEALTGLIRPGGFLLIGEGYWRRRPNPEYLTFLGCGAADQLPHGGNVALGVELGLTPLYTCVASEGDFDHYEGMYLNAMERYCRINPDDPDTPPMRQRIRAWRDSYFRWGRHTLGFGLYLFLK